MLRFMLRSLLLAIAAILLTGVSSAHAAGATLVSIATPRGAKQAFILIKPEKPVASVILFAGGHGALGLQGATAMKWGAGNFLVRSRDLFADAQLSRSPCSMRPSDRQQGMNAIFRMSGAHAGDIGAVADYLKQQAAVPVWLVGTSMGTFSAAGGRHCGAKSIDGLVLTSTITRDQARLEDRGQPSRRRRQHGAAADRRSHAHRLASQGRLPHHARRPTLPKLSKRLTKRAARSRWRCSTAATRPGRIPARRTHSTGSSASSGRRSIPSPSS